jgi:cobyrinic acid a,c-diamide synthase
VAEFVDVDKLIEVAGRAGEIIAPNAEVPQANRRCRIAVADDVCFGLCFQDNLDLLRGFGADLAPFSPIADTDIPSDIGGIYLTGGYLGEYGRDLGINAPMRKAIKEFVSEGGLVFAEGSSAAYLCRQFRWGEPGEQSDGVGVFDVVAGPGEGIAMCCDGATVDESILGSAGQLVKGINSDEWRFGRDFPILKALRVSSPGGRVVMDGFCPTPHALITFGLWHFGSNPQMARNLVDAAEIAMVK